MTIILIGNSGNTKNRQQGKYYDDKWEKVLAADPGYVSITSYNEWMEGKLIKNLFILILTTVTLRHADRKRCS